MATKRLEVIIAGNAKDAQKAFGDLAKSADVSGKKTDKSLKKIHRGLLGLGVGAAAVGSFKAFEESEKVARQTAAVIKSTGNEANVTSGHISDLASELSKLGGVDDELIQSGENMLLTFTKVRNEAGKGNDVFDQATRAANDYAAATGTDVVQANKMLGKALNDPIKGLTALTKAGVSFTQQQKDQIKALVASGDTMGAQKIILAEFNKEYGGSLEANATASGKAQVAMENLAESAGSILAPGMELVAGAASKGADALGALPRPAQQAIVGVTGIGAAALIAAPKVVEMVGTLKDGATAARQWASGTGNLSTAGKALGIAGAGVASFTLTLEALNAASATHTDIAGLTTDLEQLADGSAGLSDVAATLGTDVDGLAVAFAKAAESPHDFGEAIGYLGTHFKSDTFSTGLRKAQNQVEDLDSALAGSVKSGNLDAASKAYGELAAELIDQGFTAQEVAEMLPRYWAEVDRAERSNKKAAGSAKANADATEKSGTASHDASVMLKENADRLAEIRDRANEATAKIKDFYDAQTGAISSQIDAERALDGVTASVKEHGRELSIDTESGRQNREAIIAAKDAALEYSMTLRDQQGTGAAIAAMDQYRQRLYDTLIQSGYTEAQTKALIDEMGLTPTDIWTTFGSNATEAEGRAADVKQSIERVPGWKDIYFNAITDEAKAQIAELSSMLTPLGSSVLSGSAGAAVQQSTQAHVGHKAGGGSVYAGTFDVVGEHGPELVRWGRDGTVIPAARSRQMMGGGGGPVVFNIYETRDAEDTARKVAAIFNRQTRMGGTPFHFSAPVHK